LSDSFNTQELIDCFKTLQAQSQSINQYALND